MQPLQPVHVRTPMSARELDAVARALACAMRAPSSHNSQPWCVRLSPDAIELRADVARRLGAVDPHGREWIMSCGAFLFSLRCALAHAGYGVKLDPFPDTHDAALVARIALRPSSAEPREAQLFAALDRRQTQRGPFLSEPLPQGLVEALHAAAEAHGAWLAAFTTGTQRSALAALVAAGDREQWRDPRFREELASWMRPNDSSRGDGLAGHTIGLGLGLSRLAPWVIRRFDAGKTRAAADRKLMIEAPWVVVLATDDDERADWLAAGQALQHVLLRAAAEGVSAGFMNQPLQCPSLRPRLDAWLARPAAGGAAGRTGHAQVLLRLGRAHLGRPSARRPLSEVVDAQTLQYGARLL